MPVRLTPQRLIARSAELGELARAYERAAAGDPRLVLVAGESGVGKTRLLAEFARWSDENGARVLRGEAVGLGESDLPYAALTGALRPLTRTTESPLHTLGGRSRAHLATLLPGLVASDAPGGGPDEQGQLQLFEALLDALTLLSSDRPLVLILEDLHWADPSTRTFLSFLARSLRNERILVAATYRSDELHRRHPLRPLLAELDRLELVRRLDVAPFDEPSLTEALADILGHAAEPEVAARFHQRTEGNPLYLEELLAAGRDGRGAAPESLRDAFLLRLERLGPAAQQAVRVLAVAREADEATLLAVTGLREADLLAALRAAVAEQVLVTTGDGALGFRHALLRESVYDDLLPGERVQAHLALARFLEGRETERPEGALAHSGPIARHYAAAGDQAAALRWSVRAATVARGARAYAEAAEQAERALELWPRVDGAAALAELELADLMAFASEVHRLAGDRARSEVLLRSALEELGPHGSPERIAELMAALARIQWSLNRGEDAVATAEAALTQVPPEAPVRVGIEGWLARVRLLRGRFREAIEHGEPALSGALAIGDTLTQSEVLDSLGMAHIALGQVDRGRSEIRQSIDLARTHGEWGNLAVSYGNLADLLNLAGRSREALEVALEGIPQVTGRVDYSRRWLKLTASEVAFEAGDWELAQEWAAAEGARTIGRQLILQHARLAELALALGDHEAAERSLAEIAQHINTTVEPQWIGIYGALRAELDLRNGEPAAARRAVAEAIGRLECCTDDVMRVARLSAMGVRVEADLAQRARDLGRRAEERDALARARIEHSRLRAAASEGGPVENAWRAEGEADLARARGRSRPELWGRAAAQWEAIERPYRAACAHWRAAAALAESGDRTAAATHARTALVTAERLGARWLERELLGLSERGRLALERPGSAPPDPEQHETGDPFGLTQRERQVLALLAQGATNRQIGEALFMAEKTASVHVSRILGKLGVQGRTQAAALAYRLQLV